MVAVNMSQQSVVSMNKVIEGNYGCRSYIVGMDDIRAVFSDHPRDR
jgi:hypothetical protein